MYGIVVRLAAVRHKSFYDLRFAVAPGGARMDAHYVRGSLDEVKADLAAELAKGMSLYLLCWYGADLSLDVYQHGALTRSIDLHPFLTISVEGYPEITFTGPGKPVGHDFTSDEEQYVDEDSLSSLFFMGELEEVTEAVVDWDRVGAPSLLGAVAEPGDHLAVCGERLDEAAEAAADVADLRGAGYLPYGFTDLEM